MSALRVYFVFRRTAAPDFAIPTKFCRLLHGTLTTHHHLDPMQLTWDAKRLVVVLGSERHLDTKNDMGRQGISLGHTSTGDGSWNATHSKTYCSAMSFRNAPLHVCLSVMPTISFEWQTHVQCNTDSDLFEELMFLFDGCDRSRPCPAVVLSDLR